MRTEQELRDTIKRNPFAQSIGMELLDAGEDRARARIRLQPQLDFFNYDRNNSDKVLHMVIGKAAVN